ncbi:YcnI family protein [Rhodococcus sp. X156]|uniref:YcnI family copper-binding membrane protein n=1 Tax=Rhodococcus sp. X156 TaxID=2499145 RepID=UPI000FDC3E0F|nr:YcnI family protein [Rhodococcus sp. X156]
MNSWIMRACATAGALTVAGTLATGTAAAHVSVSSPDAAQGGYTVLTFRVPNESPTAATTGLKVTLPAQSGEGAPMKSVRTSPTPGWTATVEKDPATSVPTSVTWTAQPGAAIGDGQFGQFLLQVGPLPTTDSLSLPAEQVYSDGTVVRWDQQATVHGDEPEHPAPSLTLAAAAPTSGHGSTSAATQSSTAPEASSGSDTTARWLGGAGLVLGALGLGLGAGAVLRSRRHA